MGKNNIESEEGALKENSKRRNKRVILVVAGVFSLYILHLYLAYDSFSFMTSILKGDIIQITSLVLTAFTVTGWVIIYRVFKNIP